MGSYRSLHGQGKRPVRGGLRRSPHGPRHTLADGQVPTVSPLETGLAEVALEPTRDNPSRGILRGLSWGTTGQVVSVATSLALTPFLLVRLGATRYGIVALTASVLGLLSNLDGGVNPCCDRYFNIFAASADRRRWASFFVTAVVLLCLVQGLVAAGVADAAPVLMGILHAPQGARDQAIWYVRISMFLVVAAALQGLLVKVLRAERRWRYLNIVGTGATMTYAAVAAAMVADGWGLRGVLIGSAAQQVVALVGFGIPALRALDFGHCRPMRTEDIRNIVSFGARAQVAELSSSIGYELNTIIVAAIFPVGDVAYFTIGSNFSSSLVSLPLNALTPMVTSLGRAFGTGSLAGALREFDWLQKRWLQAIAAFPLVGALAAFYGVSAWLGPRYHVAAEVAAVLLVGQSATVFSVLVDTLGKVANRPGLESRYLTIGAVLNVGLCVPLALSLGILGIPLSVAASQVLSAVLCVLLVDRHVHRGAAASFRAFPKRAVAVACAVTFALEAVAHPVVPQGPLGLCLCALPAVVGLGAYFLIMIGRRRALDLAAEAWHRGRSLVLVTDPGAGGAR